MVESIWILRTIGHRPLGPHSLICVYCLCYGQRSNLCIMLAVTTTKQKLHVSRLNDYEFSLQKLLILIAWNEFKEIINNEIMFQQS